MITEIKQLVEGCLKDKRVSLIDGLYVVTDRIDYSETDQVFPLHPENQFFLDEIVDKKIKGAKVLEIGLGSGILSMGAVKKGAETVVGLEINPRAKNYAGFNILLNGLEDKIEIRDGDIEDLFKPVEGEKFDYIISNPPFEPTPERTVNYLHSSGGTYGLDFFERIIRDMDDHLNNDEYAQIVTLSPGNERGLSMLPDVVDKYLSGRTDVRVNPVSIGFDEFVKRFVEIGIATEEQVEKMVEKAVDDDITHLYLCMIHHTKSAESSVNTLGKSYDKWTLPIGSDVPMGYQGEEK